jgi:hypothetical protein
LLPLFCRSSCSIVVIEKHYRGTASRSVVEAFCEEVRKYPKREVRVLFAMLLNLDRARSLMPRATGSAANHRNLKVLFIQYLPQRLVLPSERGV